MNVVKYYYASNNNIILVIYITCNILLLTSQFSHYSVGKNKKFGSFTHAIVWVKIKTIKQKEGGVRR